VSGICGIVNFDGAPVDPEVLKNMAQAAAHRGPNGIHYHTEGSVGFAHLALNITPESVRERQPLRSREGDLVLTADARIDNREELIRTLRAKKHLREDAPTDADLILGAYRCWGEECPAPLIGDFAFAVWDARRKRLFAARDAMGIRALYYRVEPRRVLFATEVKQVLAAPGVEARIFEPAVAAHLAGPFGLKDWSFYEGISQLAPAHTLVVDRRGHRSWRYWDIDPDHRIEYSTEEEYVEHFLEIFEEAVRCRLRSVKPIGILLSGGMDSGSIASMAGSILRRDGSGDWPDFHTYSWAYEALPDRDERHISEIIADHYGFPVTDVPADEAWPLKDYPAHAPDRDAPMIWYLQPLMDWSLTAASSQGVGLVLSGDRGDSAVGDWAFDHLGLLGSGQLRTLWEELRTHASLQNRPLSSMVARQLLKPFLLGRWPRGVGWALEKRQKLRGVEAPPPYPDWVRPEFARRVGLAEVIEQSRPKSEISDYARRLRYEDIFSLAFFRLVSLDEQRRARFGLGYADPWGDRRLTSFVLAAPQWAIQWVREPKRIARQAMRGVMPERARHRAQKVGAAATVSVVDLGFKTHDRETILGLIKGSQAAARGYLDEDVLLRRYESFLRDERQPYDFWWPLTLEMWLRQHWS
jgi:asparagine synthase (glutamine-hydrolysing)